MKSYQKLKVKPSEWKSHLFAGNKYVMFARAEKATRSLSKYCLYVFEKKKKGVKKR